MGMASRSLCQGPYLHLPPYSRNLCMAPKKLPGAQARKALLPPCLLVWQEEWKLLWKTHELTNAPKSGL